MGKTFVRGDTMADLFDIAVARKLSSGGGGGGSSDFSTAEVTVIANSGSGAVGLTGGISGFSEGFAFIKNGNPKMLVSVFGVPAGTSNTAQALLVEGYAEYELDMGMNVSVTGDCTYDDEEGVFVITGDCTITADPTT